MKVYQLYNKAKWSNLQDNWKAYWKIKNSINTTLKEVHNFYYRRLFDKYFSGDHWQFLRYVRAKHQDKHNIPTLFINHQSIHSTKGKHNALNSHFKSVFTEEDLLTIPTVDTHTDVYIPSMPNISYFPIWNTPVTYNT